MDGKKMNNGVDNKKLDYAILKPTAAWKEISAFVEEAQAAGACGITVAPSAVKKVKTVCGGMRVGTVAGYPLGFSTTAAKAYEIKNAIRNGADEVAAVINFCEVKSRKFNNVAKEVRKLKEASKDIPLTMIIETANLSNKEKFKLCEVLSNEKPDFVQTSTGYLKGSATTDDLALLRQNLSADIRLRAAGGIESLDWAQSMFSAGADRVFIKLKK